MVTFRGLRRELSEKNDVAQMLGGEKTGNSDVERTLFPRLLDVLIFAALLGYKNKKRVKLVGEKETIANDQLIAKDPNRGYPVSADKFILLIAASELSQDEFREALREEDGDTMLTIVEEYANGGLEIILGWYREKVRNKGEPCLLDDIILPNLREELE